MAAQILRCRRGRFFGYSGAILWAVENLFFIVYGSAKYAHFTLKIATVLKSLFRVVENSKFLNRLRNVHPEKSAVTGIFPSLTFTHDRENTRQGAP